MKKLIYSIFVISILSSCNSKTNELKQDIQKDESSINKTIEDWDHAWKIKDVELAIKDYANETDWTNAFGDRVQNKSELKKLLGIIFAMDFVMTGENNYGNNEIDFINQDVAIVRSQNIRINQTWPDGSIMPDRYVNHLRVYNRISGNWKIVSHMISQAHEKMKRE